MNPVSKYKIIRLGIIMFCIILFSIIARRLDPGTQSNILLLSTPHVKNNSAIPGQQTNSQMNMKPLVIKEDAPVKVTKPTPPPAVQVITAKAYLVGNLETGALYLSKNDAAPLQIASISKLFTALALKQNLDTSSTITITDEMLKYYPEDTHKLKIGDTFTLDELMYPLILESDNNIAQAIASSTNYADFISNMDDVTHQIGMSGTHFADSSGLSDGNISTASDLFLFARYLYLNESSFLNFTALPSKVLEKNNLHDEYEFKNTNVFVGDPHYIGGKTGRSDLAGETMLSLFKYEINGKQYPLAIIVLHSDYGKRQLDSEALYIKAIEKITKI